MTAVSLIPWMLLAIVLGLSFWLRQRDRATLRATEGTLQRISQAVESASDAIGIGDMEGTSLYHNRAHIGLFGYSVEELNAVPEGGVLFADRAVAVQIHTSIRAGISWAGETDVRTKDGRVVPCFVRADIIRDERGEPVGIFGVFSDITERRRTQRQLDEQRQRLEITLQSIGDAVITTDAAGRVILLNAVAEHYTGWTKARAAGQPVAELLAVRDEATHSPRESLGLRLLREPKRGRSADAYLLLGPGGTERLIAENAALIKSADGQVAGAVLALRDITRERKQADEVARAGKLESLGLMAGSIAHDFGNLLTAIVSNISLAHYTPGLPPEAKERLDAAERAVWRARDVTQQLTTFAKGGTMQKKVVALAPLLREASGFATQATAVQARYQIAEELWPVLADESQLVQVINNLAVNAVQAMPDGGTLLVTAENCDPESDSPSSAVGERWIRIGVTDTGVGIPPENLAKIFEPFFTTKRSGSGFGLAKCYSVVKKHHGHLNVESMPGRGTTFTILLPAAGAEAGDASARPFPPQQESKRTLGRVLLMDDDRNTRESMTLMLGLLDYEVTEAVEGGEALEKYLVARGNERPFDAVVFDLKVPDGMGGAETARRLREFDPQCRAIAISGSADDPVFSDCRAHGFDVALTKPFKMAQLDAALKMAPAGKG